MARKRPQMNLKKKPEARTGDLAELFTSDADTDQGAMQLLELRLDAIEADPTQPRKLFDETSLTDLSASIALDGLIQPIEVVQIGRNHYRIIHGERRWRASQLAELETISAIVRRRDYDEVTRFVRQMVENIQREDLNDIDRAAALTHLRELMQDELNAEAEQNGEKPWSTKASWAKVAERLGMTRQRVNQLISLLKLPVEIQDSIREGALSERDTRVFQGLTMRQQRALHRARVIDGVISQAETKRVAQYIKRGETASVETAIKAVQAGHDKRRKTQSDRRRDQINRRVSSLTKALDGFEVEGLDSAESKQLITQLNSIQTQLHELINQLN